MAEQFKIWEGERWTVEQVKDSYIVHSGDFIVATFGFTEWRPAQAKAYAELIGAAPETAAERDRLAKVNEQLVEVLEEWETPGNHRDNKWWPRWEAKRRAALAEAQKPNS